MSSPASHIVSWFEIPSVDFERAVRFYETALGTTLRREDFGGQPMGIFPYAEPATGGCIVAKTKASPSTDGVLIYLNAQPSVDAVLARVEKAGGKVDGPVVELPQGIGFIGFIIDTEGNRVGLHSPTNG
ncbi:VOC family protein [Paraburkholderia sp. DHOC27]|uniref:VOC family protein n=1 Tax=Paraburkholderia sp. DHOC27 TaxID=2303330 RepID=UPI000E3BAB49|nr:VOC family protein [Paraburkholderia sp. DHOC27]RFU45850.1 VOC family protein [Paraburkholderia sp. DHOC27]